LISVIGFLDNAIHGCTCVFTLLWPARRAAHRRVLAYLHPH
jgi:hypothetical protein